MLNIRVFSWIRHLHTKTKLSLLLTGIVIAIGSAAGAQYVLRQGNVTVGPIHLDRSRIAANNQYSENSMAASAGTPRMAWQHLAVIDETDHPFGHRVSAELVARLRKLPGVMSVDTRAPLPADAQRLPDLVFRISLNSFAESNVLLSRKITANISMTMDNGTPAGVPNISSGISPILQFSLHGTLTHESTAEGDGVGSDSYRLSAPNAADELAKHVQQLFAGWHDKPGALPELPATMYGPYVPAADLNFLEPRHAACIQSGYGLLTHNDSWYRWTETGSPLDVARNITEILRGQGWKVDSTSTDALPKSDEISQVFVHLHKGDMEILLDRASEATFRVSMPFPAGHQETFLLHYVHHFSPAQRQTAVQTLLDAHRMEAGLFALNMSPQQRDAWATLVENQPWIDVQTTLIFISSIKDRDPAKARQLLRSANVVARMSGHDHTFEERQELAKGLGMELTTDMLPSKKDLMDAGAKAFDSGKPFLQEIGLDQPLLFYGNNDGQPWAAEISVVRDTDGQITVPVVFARHNTMSFITLSLWAGSGGREALTAEEGIAIRAVELVPGSKYRITANEQ